MRRVRDAGTVKKRAEKGSYRFGDTLIKYTVVRSKRRKKTIEITLNPQEGVLMAVPSRTSNDEIEAVMRKRAAWIVRKATSEVLNPRPRRFENGESLLYLGREVTLSVESVESRNVGVKFDGRGLRLCVPAELTGAERLSRITSELTGWYKSRAEHVLPQIVESWQGKLGRSPSNILIRDQSQRWGSCASDDTIRFNWRIIMAEPALVDYVVVHELAHLSVHDHSRKFWGEVERVMPDYKVRRQKLKEVGPYLYL